METQLFYPHIRWNWFKKFLVRFGVIFFALQILPGLYIIGGDVYPWIAKTFFSINEISLEGTGSGDMYYHYMELFFCFVVALIGSIIWSFFNKKNKTYDTLIHWFLVFIRYYLAYSMLSYGYSKIFYNQFGAPSLTRLLQPYGDSSPMGIAWTFIGASKPYTVFSGLAELLGGLLLLTRRTTLLGAMVSFAVMFNVMMLNYCYDVPVKLYSTQLVVLSVIIIVCNGYYLWNAIWFQRATDASTYKPLFAKKGLVITRIIVKSLVVFYLVGFDGYNQYQSIEEAGPDAPQPTLYGIYKPTQLIKNSDTLRLYSDSTEWKYFIVDMYSTSIKQLNDRRIRLVFEADSVKKEISMHEETDTTYVAHLTYKNLNDTTLQINGIYKKDTIHYTLGKVNLNSFRLIGRGFHWVNEFPFNR